MEHSDHDMHNADINPAHHGHQAALTACTNVNTTSLKTVLELLHDFYSPNTNNERKRELEAQLLAFKAHPDSWKLVLDVATDKRAYFEQEYLWFFALATIEGIIIERTTKVTSSDRNFIHQRFWNCYTQLSDCAGYNNAKSAYLPAPLRDKLAQIIVQLARCDSMLGIQHLNNCLELIRTNFLLGVTLLRVTSEVHSMPSSKLNTDNERHFNMLIAMRLPAIMNVLTAALLIVVYRVDGSTQLTLPHDDLYCLSSVLPNDNLLSPSAIELLQCVRQYLNWLPNCQMPEYCIQSILDLAAYRPNYLNITLKAIAVLNEFFCDKKILPFLKNVTNILGTLLSRCNAIDNVEYVDSYRDMFCNYLKGYWQRVMVTEAECEIALCKTLYNHTFDKSSVGIIFVENLKLWQPVIDGLIKQESTVNREKLLFSLVTEIIGRMLNETELETLDNSLKQTQQAGGGDAEESNTELQTYRRTCIECLTRISEKHAVAVFRQISAHWAQPFRFIINIEFEIDKGNYDLLRKQISTRDFRRYLRDFYTICQALVSIAPMLELNDSNDTDAVMKEQLTLLANNLLALLNFFQSNKLYSINLNMMRAYEQEINHVYAEVITAIRIIYQITKSININEIQMKLGQILSDIFMKARNENQASNDLIYIAASELLLCITSKARSKCLLRVPEYIQLINSGPFDYLPTKAANNIYTSIVSNLILPWVIDEHDGQDFVKRAQILRDFIGSYACEFLKLEPTPSNATRILSELQKLVESLTAVIDYLNDANNNAKQMLSEALQQIVIKSVTLLNYYGQRNPAIMEEVSKLILSVLRGFPAQLGGTFINEMISVFLNVCNREPNTKFCYSLICKILQIFHLIVIQPGHTSTAMLPSIIDFTIGNILPLAQNPTFDCVDDKNDDIASLTYALFDRILFCQWHFFYGRQLLATNGTQAENLHPTQFLAILNAYGQVLTFGEDMTIIAAVLNSLEEINTTWHIFSRRLFQDQLLDSFVAALVGILAEKTRYSLIDFVMPLLFEMGQVDKQILRDNLMRAPIFTDRIKLLEICDYDDIPTFTLELNHLIISEFALSN